MKRSTRYYRKNEAEVMRALGIEPTKNSGAGWVEKEDGQNEFLICQLKSTDAQSIGVKQKDLQTLEYNAGVAHKIPLFAIQFLNTGEVWVMAKPCDLPDVAEYLETGKHSRAKSQESFEVEHTSSTVKKVIKSSSSARELFYIDEEAKAKEKEKQWKKRLKSRR